VKNKSVSRQPLPGRRYLGVFLPLLSSERIKQKWPDLYAKLPFVLTEKQRGAVIIMAADDQAQALGIGAGMTLADARARVPELSVIAYDAGADADLLNWLADGCNRYTPMVALVPPYGLILDVTGCTHLFVGGEGELGHDLVDRMARHSLSVQTAFASTPDAALALARYSAVDARALPMTALPVADDVHSGLRRAGLYTLGDLADRPRAPLAARFGQKTATLLARLLGEEDIGLTPRRAIPALSVEKRFAEPIAREEDVLSTLDMLVQEIAEQLSHQDNGGRRFEAMLFRSDGYVARLFIETSAPTRDGPLLNRLFRERISSLSDPLDPGFGYDMIQLGVPVTEPLSPQQLKLEGGQVVQAEVAALIDRLTVRLGRNRLRRMYVGDSHIPERADPSLPAADGVPRNIWPQPESGEPPLRPLYIFDPPQLVIVMAQVPDGPPRRFRWRQSTHDVTRYEGPERISAEWWRRRNMKGLTRDYYRVEDENGRRFWLFRHGLYGDERANPDWYLHGLFA
jgi:protein ImuB